MTLYLVLKAIDDVGVDPVWQEVRQVEASSPSNAIKAVDPGDGSTYVAPPARSWDPVTVRIEQRTLLTSGKDPT